MRHHFWEWYIPTYLFLGGLGGGIMCLSMILYVFVSGCSEAVAVALWFPVFFALACIAIGCCFLILDLGQPFVFYRAFVKNKSVIAWGARLLSVCMIFAALWWLSYIPLDFFQPLDDLLAPFRAFNMVVSGICGAGVMLYTGAMLSTLKAHSFWATPALPILFTISALSTGCAGIMLCAGIHPAMGLAANVLATEAVRNFVHVGDIILVFAEITVLLVMVLSFLGAGNPVQTKVAHRWVHGSYAILFWVCMLGLGLIVPQIINIFCGEIAILAHVVGPLLVLCGGCLLRFMCIQTDDRAECAPGEDRYFNKLKKKGEAEFLTRWTSNVQNDFYWYSENEF